MCSLSTYIVPLRVIPTNTSTDRSIDHVGEITPSHFCAKVGQRSAPGDRQSMSNVQLLRFRRMIYQNACEFRVDSTYVNNVDLRPILQ